MKKSSTPIIACFVLLVSQSRAADTMPYCGSATITLQEGTAPSVGWIDAYFGDLASRGQTLTDPAPGDAPYVRLSGFPGTIGTSTTIGIPGEPGMLLMIDNMRSFGEIPGPPLPDTYPGVPGVSRSRQVTTLVVDPANILGSWTASNDAFGVFVGNTTVGEQIAFTGIQRWGGPFTGMLIYGDFAIRHAPARAGQPALEGVLSGLVLTSNVDFLGASFADLANASITSDGRTMTINADLLISGGLYVLDGSAVVGTKFGTLSLTTCLASPDVNGDDRTDIEDMYAWEQSSGARDVNASGGVDGEDRQALLKVIRCRELKDMTASRR